MPPPSKTPVLPGPGVWAAEQGQRLQFLRAQLVNETMDTRSSKLEACLRDALQAVPPPQRKTYLGALAEQFPTWREEPSTTVDSAIAVPVELTPSELTEKFFELLPALAPAQRDEVKQRLAAAGMVTVAPGKGLEGEALVDLQTKLKLLPTDPIDAQRLGKLFATFAEVMLTLDQLVWNVWKGAAPKSPIRRDTTQGDLRTLVRRSLAGDAEASATLVQQQLESTRQLIAGLIAGLGPAGQEFARKFQERYSPDAIRAAVLADGGGGLFTNAEVKCWKRYTELGVELTDTSIENDVRDAVVKYAEDLIRGRRG